jgi:Flp pilus assembly protein TadD
VTDDARIDEMRRRLQDEPASRIFVQLAEEYRRAGRLDDAIAVCRDGLATHPDDTSARVVLGLSLMAKGSLEDARRELEGVLSTSPGNVAAHRGLGAMMPGRDMSGPDGDAAGTGQSAAQVRRLEGFLAAIQRARAGSRT